jgi:bifunctional UDP-N-acetylglucosamine pyrophosphorylase/glucosamine-1-phosphate N-acetyltransferase
LRPGTQLGQGAKIGNFVETKKSQIGDGSKINHLSYIGDAVLGSGVNVGAGTITCNYDGVDKHQTILADDVFVGSNSTLVAPISVGKGSFVGAASVITKSVDENSLAISRSKQKNLVGWLPPKKRN